jgi:hypothetical protein
LITKFNDFSILVFRNRCNGTKNGEPCGLRKPDFVAYGVPLIKNKALYKEGDWDCWRYKPFISILKLKKSEPMLNINC